MAYPRHVTRFATLIRETREQRGWSQQELAERTGVDRKTISRWEAGTNVPDPEQAIAAASALGLSSESAFRAIGWLPDGLSARQEVLQLIAEMSDDEREQFVIEVLELEARRRRNSQ